jgi:hypothetical protein
VDQQADRRRLGAKSSWSRVAQRLGLQIRTDEPHLVVFEGRHAGCAIELRRTTPNRRVAEWTLVVARADVDPKIKLTKENAVTRAKKLLGHEDVLTGAAGFDYLVYVEGDAPHLVAALDDKTRAVAYRLIERGASVQGGALHLVRRSTHDYGPPEHLRQDIVDASRLLRRLGNATDDLRTQLLKNARDRNEGVRIHTLDLLRRTYPYDVGALDWPLEPDAPTEVAWRVALMSSRSDAGTLARWANDRALDLKARGAFIARLEALLPAPRALDALLAQLDQDLSGAATRRLLAHADDPSVVRSLDPQALALLFERATDVDRVRLAHTLGEVGASGAIEVLVEYASGFLLSRAVKDAARRAVQRIERRAKTHRGHLSVTTAQESGTLSLSGEAGRLALSDDDP